MSIESIAVIALCLFGGYWVVALLMDAFKTKRAVSQESHETPWPIVLGVDPHASTEEIRQAYRLRMSEYHQDSRRSEIC